MARVIGTSVQEYPGFRTSVIQYQPTPRPIEDRYSITMDDTTRRLILGVYDGHGGAATAEHIRTILPPALLCHPPAKHAQVFRGVDDAMLSAFTKDHSILRSRSKAWIQHANVIKSGCTALILDINVSTLIAAYANAGDCRTVISQSSGEPFFQTLDMNAKSPLEQVRLKAEHPDEDLLIVSGRLFGKVMTTRGFGDGYYKLPNGLVGNKQHRHYIDVLSSLEDANKVPMNQQYDLLFYGYKTPPYLTATPATGSLRLQEHGVAILASDGLWDLIGSAAALEIVEQGIQNEVMNLAQHLLESVLETKAPGDDVTILILQLYDSHVVA